MKIIFKTEREILKEVEFTEMTNEIQEELQNSFDNRQILKYEITFKEGVVVQQVHNISDVTEKVASALTITIV